MFRAANVITRAGRQKPSSATACNHRICFFLHII